MSMSQEPEVQPGWSRAQVSKRIQWAPGLITLRLSVAPNFEAGQFFNLGLYLDGEFVRRAYSAASAPGHPLEFFIAEVDDGEFSPALFALTEGQHVWVEDKPQGFFTLRYVPAADELWLLATGTGLGPFIAMLRSRTLWERCQRVIVVHGVRDASQLAYQAELAQLSEQHPLTVVTCLSRARAAAPALEGRITQALSNGSLERAAGVPISPSRSHVMLCGNPDMLAEVTTLLVDRGLAKHRQRKPGHITTEKYW
jgi:ferredoxin--NADP+ reductase